MIFSEENVVTASGLVSETVRIPTTNPINFYQAMSEPGSAPETEILGKLFLPEGLSATETGPWAVVVIVPGSLGVAPSHLAKADLLNDAGIATCVIDPFGARSVTSTVANQTQYSFAASACDVLATVDMLATHTKIDSSRIGVQGHSRGGSAVLSAASMAQLMDGARPNAICGVYAAYPWSGQQFLNPVVGNTVVRAVIGDRDEWCLPQQVQAHMHAITLTGGNATCRIFPGAQHSFDRDTPSNSLRMHQYLPAHPQSISGMTARYFTP